MFPKRVLSSLLIGLVLAAAGVYVRFAQVSAATATLAPTTIGNFDDWSVNTGTKVNAVAADDGDTTYINEDRDNKRETFGVPGAGVPAGSTINSVTLEAVARRDEGGAKLKLRVEKGTAGGDVSDGASINLDAAYTSYTRTMATNPFTSAVWTVSEVNDWLNSGDAKAIKFGVANDASKRARVTKIAVTVDYTLPTTLTVNKVLVPSNDNGKFNLRIDGATAGTGADVGDGGTTGAVVVATGTRTVSETAGTNTSLSDYTSVVSGDCAANGNVTLTAGQSKTCTITNTKKGTIIVEKQTIPDGVQDSFVFTGDAAGTIGDNGTISVSSLVPGVYTSTEIVPPGWNLTSLICDDQNSIGDLDTATATFNIEPGEVVKCTFENTKDGSIAVMKFEDLDGNGVKDEGEPGKDGVAVAVGRVIGPPDEHNNKIPIEIIAMDLTGGGGMVTLHDIPPGPVKVFEKKMSGWVPTTPPSLGQIDSFFDITYRIDLVPGEPLSDSFFDGFVEAGQTADHGCSGNPNSPLVVVCLQLVPLEFGNFELITVTVQKELLDPSGQPVTNDPHQFTVKLDGNPQFIDALNDGMEALYGGVGPGPHTLEEVIPGDPDFDLLRITANGNEDPTPENGATFTPTSGEPVTIIVTNKQKPGRILIDKATEGGDDTFDFDGDNNLGTKHITTQNGHGQSDPQVIDSFFDITYRLGEEFTVTEQPQDEWTTDPNPCVVVVNPGEEKTCYFTNTKKAHIIVKKVTVGGDDSFSFNPSYGAPFNLSNNGQNDSGPLVPPGPYSVAEGVLPTGWSSDGGVCDGNNNTPASITLLPGATVTCTFTNTKQEEGKGEIHGLKFEDRNGNGVRNLGEPGLAGWTIVLNPGGLTTVTMADDPLTLNINEKGMYWFTELPPNTYVVSEEVRDGWMQTAPANPGTYTIELAPDMISLHNNFGNFKLGEIHGVKYEDVNGNGNRNSGETGLAGWTMYLDANNNGVLDDGEVSVVTGGNGGYWFMNLGPGTYHVREVPRAGWVSIEPDDGVYDISMRSGFVAKKRDFGNAQFGSIHGMKFNDLNGNGKRDDGEPGLAGWTIELNGPHGLEMSTQTNEAGLYWFMDLGPGKYVVREVNQRNWRQTTRNPKPIALRSGTISENNDFGNRQKN